LLLAPFTSMPFDVQGWYQLSQRGFLDAAQSYYTPVWPLLLVSLGALGRALSLDTGSTPVSLLPPELDLSGRGVSLVTTPSFNLLVKLPLIASDLAITFLIYKIVTQTKEPAHDLRAAIILWYLNPFSIAISSAWGMYDTVAALFVILGVYLLTRKGRSTVGVMSLWASAAVKLYALALLPATGIYLCVKKQGKAFLVLLMTTAIAIVISLVFFRTALEFLASVLLVANPYPHFSMGLSYWTILLLSPIPSGIQIALSDLVMALLGAIVVYWITRISFNDPERDLTVAYASSMIVIYLSVRGVNPQWFIWCLPLLAVLIAKGAYEKKLFWLSSVIGTLFLLAMFHIFIYPLAAYYPDELAWLYSSLTPVRTIAAGEARVVPGIRPGTVVLWILGTSFSVSMLLTLVEILFKPQSCIIGSVASKLRPKSGPSHGFPCRGTQALRGDSVFRQLIPNDR